MSTMQRHDPAAEAFKRLFCWVFCRCEAPLARPVVTLKLGNGISVTFTGDTFMLSITVDQVSPIALSIDKFVDDKGNTTTDADIPVWASSDPTVVAIVPNAAPDQGAVATPTGKAGASNLTAAFGDQTKLGTPGNYLLTGTVTVNPGLAVAGTIEANGQPL